MKIKIKKFSWGNIDDAVGTFIVSCLYVMLIYSLFRRIFNMGEVQKYAFLTVLVAAFLFLNFNSAINIFLTKHKRFFLCELIVLSVYLWSYLLGYASINTIGEYIAQTGLVCVPMFVVASTVINLENMYQVMVRGSYGLVVLSTLCIVVKEQTVYSMGFSYILLMPMLVLVNELFRKITVQKMIAFLYIFFLVLLFGSRGAIFCVLVFVIARFLLVKGSLGLKLLTIISSIILFVFYQQIGMWVLDTLSSYGLYSRSLTLLFTQIDYVSGRDSLKEIALELISKNRWIGYGASSTVDLMGGYPHNVFLEILLDYGTIAGTIFIIGLVFFLLIFFIRSRSDLALVFICWGFVPLILSGSYMTDWKFAFLIGLAYGQIKNVCNVQIKN